jgi:DNA polymerase III subunit delta'
VIFPDVLGHEHAREALGRMLGTDRVPHALLFHGPEGVGKRMLADRFAASLLCVSPQDGAMACGRCAACVKASHGNHPDLLVIARLPKIEAKGVADAAEPDEDGEDALEAKSGDLRKWIVVSQIRELTEHASYAPREGRRRIFLIDPADRMNAEAQNALLKTLEEPPERTLILLVASRPHVLLPTVRSRSFQLGLAPMSPGILADALTARGFSREEARSRAALAEGRPGRAMTLDLAVLAKRRNALLAALEALAASPAAAAAMTTYVDELLGDDEAWLHESFDLLAALLRDAARSASGEPAILHADVASRVAALGRALGATRAAELLGLSDRLRGDLRLNVNKTLLAETMFAAVAGGPVPV